MGGRENITDGLGGRRVSPPSTNAPRNGTLAPPLPLLAGSGVGGSLDMNSSSTAQGPRRGQETKLGTESHEQRSNGTCKSKGLGLGSVCQKCLDLCVLSTILPILQVADSRPGLKPRQNAN